MTNETLHVVFDDRLPWFIVVLEIISILSVALSVFMLIYGKTGCRRSRSTVPVAKVALVSSILLLALAFFASLRGLAFYFFFRGTNELGAAQTATYLVGISRTVDLLAWALLSISTGFITAVILWRQKPQPSGRAYGSPAAGSPSAHP